MEMRELVVGKKVWHKRQGIVTVREKTTEHVFVQTDFGDILRIARESVPAVLAPLNAKKKKTRMRSGNGQRKKPSVPFLDPIDHLDRPFCAIDFETANYRRDSACAIGVVRVESGQIVQEKSLLIRPPTLEFYFTYLHGISEEDVEKKPRFPEIWEELGPITRGATFFAAHNAGFDRSVLNALATSYSLSLTDTPFACTVQVARRLWDIRPTKLPDVCMQFGIPLDHHDALSDARAVAEILLIAKNEKEYFANRN